VAKHRGIWPVTWMCEVLDVSPSGHYATSRVAEGARAQPKKLRLSDRAGARLQSCAGRVFSEATIKSGATKNDRSQQPSTLSRLTSGAPR
jgi:hypothetical protein